MRVSARAAVLAIFLFVVVGLPARADADLIAAGPNNLTVIETITEDLGLGGWLYTYNITSADPSDVWHFILYTSFATADATSTFPFVQTSGLPIADFIGSPYDATNIDPSLVSGYFTNAWFEPFGEPIGGLVFGGTAVFSFFSNTFDASAKLFAYETVASGWVFSNGTGLVAGIGRTQSVTEPSSALLLMSGLVGLAALRRRLTQAR
jgi:MYXO-CTERM domain-containing protein